MKLWSDYEGRTIAEAYPLKKLVRPEGRSAFFLTTNGTGTPALVRVIEAHFDESEILNRWRAVAEIQQENLVTMRKIGETELDGTPLVYAVMEPTEISLEELLQNRTLTLEETRELAHSLVGAIEALHSRGMVHGQIEPSNILAAGELVKLRSDCVREAVADPEREPTRAAHDATHECWVARLTIVRHEADGRDAQTQIGEAAEDHHPGPDEDVDAVLVAAHPAGERDLRKIEKCGAGAAD